MYKGYVGCQLSSPLALFQLVGGWQQSKQSHKKDYVVGQYSYIQVGEW